MTCRVSLYALGLKFAARAAGARRALRLRKQRGTFQPISARRCVIQAGGVGARNHLGAGRAERTWGLVTLGEEGRTGCKRWKRKERRDLNVEGKEVFMKTKVDI